MTGDLKTYFTWSANALMPISPGAADVYLELHRSTICATAQQLLRIIDFKPSPIYRGIILKQPVTSVAPHPRLKYLSFSTDWLVAAHFADINGFGSTVMNIAIQLGEYGYIIEYTPQIPEVLFHHKFLSILPYADGFSCLGMDGTFEVEHLKQQREIMILQPAKPFSNIIQMP